MNSIATPLPPSAVTQPAQSWFARARATVWHALELSGRARAQRHLLDFADRCDALQPELAKELRIAARSEPMT